jgi:hypothetical protein
MNLKARIFSRRNISGGIAALLLPAVIGCAVPKPVTIKHEGTPSLSEITAPRQQPRKGPVDERVAAAVADLERRKELSDQGTAALLELLKSKNVISDEEAALITAQTTTGTAEVLKEQKSVEEITEEIKEAVTIDVMSEMSQEIGKLDRALKEKDKRLRFGGDIRVRYEKDFFDENNADFVQPTNPSQLMNSRGDQYRFKYRVRFGAEAQVNDQVQAVIRLSTGSTSNPVSTNATMGDYMNKDTILFDLAYIRWQPWKPLTLYGGRMPNPWVSSDLVWDSDLNFEGLALNVRLPVTKTLTPFLTGGAFPLQQSEPVSVLDFSQHSKWLYAGQVGLERKNRKGISAKVGAAYYGFKNITGVANDPLQPGETDWTAPLFLQKGNTLFNISADPAVLKLALASEYRELNYTGTLDIGFWDPVHVVFLGDYVKNIGFKKSAVIQRTQNPDTAEEITGHQIGISVGYPTIEERKQWKVYFYSKRLGADAVVDAFTDSDFHLGGTNAKGWIFGTDVGMARNLWLGLRWLTADEISGPPLAIDVLLVDVNARF